MKKIGAKNLQDYQSRFNPVHLTKKKKNVKEGGGYTSSIPVTINLDVPVAVYFARMPAQVKFKQPSPLGMHAIQRPQYDPNR